MAATEKLFGGGRSDVDDVDDVDDVGRCRVAALRSVAEVFFSHGGLKNSDYLR